MFPIRATAARFIYFLVSLILVHSVVFTDITIRIYGSDLREDVIDGVAGQYILGGVLQPSVFGVFLLLSIYLFLKGRFLFSIIAVGVAAIMHVSYMLSAAMLVSAYAGVTFFRGQKMTAITIIILSGLIMLPAIAYVLWAFGVPFSSGANQAQEILVNFRFPHHADPQQWLGVSAYGKVMLTVLAIYLVRKTTLSIILIVSLLVGVALTALQIVTGSESIALLFPWRVSVYIVPLAVSLILGYVVCRIDDVLRLSKRNVSWFALTMTFIAILLVVINGVFSTLERVEASRNDNSNPMMNYAAASLTSGELYLIPPVLGKFRLYTGVPVYVDYKSNPYQDEDVVNWYERYLLVEEFYRTSAKNQCNTLTNDSRVSKVTHVVFSNDYEVWNCDPWSMLFSDEYYQIYGLD